MGFIKFIIKLIVVFLLGCCAGWFFHAGFNQVNSSSADICYGLSVLCLMTIFAIIMS